MYLINFISSTTFTFTCILLLVAGVGGRDLSSETSVKMFIHLCLHNANGAYLLLCSACEFFPLSLRLPILTAQQNSVK